MENLFLSFDGHLFFGSLVSVINLFAPTLSFVLYCLSRCAVLYCAVLLSDFDCGGEFSEKMSAAAAAAAAAADSVGVPIKLLYQGEGNIVTVEMKNGEVYRGMLTQAEDTMNCQLKEGKKAFSLILLSLF